MLKKALRVTIGYLIFGFVWILLSDHIVHTVLPESDRTHLVQTLKGLVFVTLSALVILALAHRELTNERRLRERLGLLEGQLHQVAERSSDLIYSYQILPEQKLIYISPSCLRITGYSQREHYSDPELGLKIIHPDDRPLLESIFVVDQDDKPLLLRWFHKSGKIIYIEQSNVRLLNDKGEVIGISGVGRDVTEAQVARLELEHLNAAYSVLWQVNRLVVRSRSTEEIYRQACEIALSTGSFLLAWIGIVSKEDNRVIPAYKAGEKLSYIENITITLDDAPTGRGPSGLAARFGKAYASYDIAVDPFMAPWRERALAHGFRSSAAFPLKIGQDVIAVWTLYSPTPGYFSERVLSLYSELAQDIGFALGLRHAEAEREKLESELEISNRRWQFATEATGYGLWDWDMLTDKIFYSESLPGLLGYSHSEWGADLAAWENRIHPEDADKVNQALQAHFQGDSVIYNAEYRMLARDGSYRWILDRGRVIEWTADKKPRRMIGLLRDITEELERRLERIEREESYAAVIAQSPHGIAVVSTETGQIFSVNPAFCRILGRSEQELLQVTWQSFTHPDDIEPNNAYNQQILRGERSEYVMQKRYFRPDGSMIWARLAVKKLQHYRKQQNVHIALVEDVSEQVERENRMRLDAAVISHTRDGVVVTDLTPRIISVNRAYTEITGYAPEEVIGKNPNILRSGRQDLRFYRKMWAEIIATGRWQGEIYNRRKNGEVYPQLSTIDTIFDEQGKPQYYVGVFSDITRLKKTEESFERLAHYDILTGLPNRLMVTSRLSHAIESAARTTG